MLERKKRIQSIDALRAFALLGVLLVHTWNAFSVQGAWSSSSTIDFEINRTFILLLQHKFDTIFNVLFGVSFYLILRNPKYSASKFVWRCVLLVLIGVVNKILYWPDTLMLYGLYGILLVAFKDSSPRRLLIYAICFLILTQVMRNINLGTFLFSGYVGDNTWSYAQGTTFSLLLENYWSNFFYYWQHIVNNYFSNCIANFMLGYMLGKIGFIESINERIKLRYIIIVGIVFVTTVVLFKYSGPFASTSRPIIRLMSDYFGAAFYSMLFIYVYNLKWGSFFLRSFEAYGRLGLTNYTFQGVCAIIILCFWGFGYKQIPLTIALLYGTAFFVLQLVFSNIWLHYFKNGPMEYAWRCATEMKILPLLKDK